MRIPLTSRFNLLFILAVSLAFTDGALADIVVEAAPSGVQVTAASGGGSISADTAANASSPTWTSLGPIVIAEPGSSKGDIGGGTLILKAPTGFVFNTAVRPSVAISGKDVLWVFVVVNDSTTITATFVVIGSNSKDTVTIGGTTRLQVRPINGAALASGNIYRPASGGGTAVINGVTATSNTSGSGGTSFGNLRTVVGSARQLAFQTGLPAAVAAGDVFSPTPVLLVQDQFGNTRHAANGVADNTTVVNAARGVGSGTLQGTTSVTAANGVATFNNLSYNKPETITVVFRSGSLPSVESGSLVVNPAAGDRLVFTTQPVGSTYGTLLATQPVVRTRDRFGNDSTFGLPASRLVTLAITSGTGSLLGVKTLDIGTAAGNGTIVFTDLQASAAGSGKILTASAAGMTNGVSSPFTVAPATVAGDITVNNKLYDATTAAVIATRTLTGVLGSDLVSLTGGSATFANKNVGTGKLVTATGLTLGGAQAANYQLASTTATNSANIAPAPLTVRADSLARTYGANNPLLTASFTGFVGGEILATSGVTGSPVLGTTAQTNSPAGPYPITVAIGTLAAQNYNFSLTNGMLTIGKAPLTVTADSYSRPYGEANPVLTATYTGFVLGENSGVLSGSPNLTTLALPNSPAGDYPIVAATGSLASDNYTFSFVNGVLNVATPDLLFSDNFTRPSDPAPTAPWVVQDGNWTVTGGGLVGGTNAPYTYGYAFLTNVWTAYTAQALIKFSPGAYGGGLAVHLNAFAGTRYAAWIFPEGSPGGSSVLKLLKFQNWTDFTVMQQVNLPGVGTTGHILKLAVRANRIVVFYDGGLMFDVTDPEPVAYLKGGIGLEHWTAESGYTFAADDVRVSLPRRVIMADDAYAVIEGSALTVGAPGVLHNDLAEFGGLTAWLESGPAHGTLNLNTNGGFTYLPDAGFTGPDAFTYRALDGYDLSDVATVTFTVAEAGPLSLDDFTRTTSPGDLSPWVVHRGNWAVSDGTLRGGTNPTFTYGNIYLTDSWTDYEAQARVQFPAGAFGGGLAGRLNAATGARYAVWVYPEGSPGGSSVWKLLKFQDWDNFTVIQQGSLAGVGTDWHLVKLVFQGNRIDFHYDNTLITSATDPAPYVSGGPGFELWTDATGYAMSADDFLATAVAPDVVVAPDVAVTALGIIPDMVARTVAVTFQGTPGGLYLVQATTNLAFPEAWLTVATNVADGNGRWTYLDSMTNRPGRYYRTAKP